MSGAGGTGCCVAGGCPPPGGPDPPPPPPDGPEPPPPGGPDPPPLPGSPGFFFCWNACCIAAAIFCDWVSAVSYVAIVVVICSVVMVIVLSGNFVVEVKGLVFNVGSIGACRICWSTVGSSVSLS